MQYLNQDNPAQWPTAKEQIEYARPKIFDFEYPFFDENKKAEFETQFIKHFFMYDLGLETPALWEFRLDEVMNLIMPYYNQLYEYKISLVYLLNASCTASINIPAQSVQPSGITSRLKPSILVGIPLSSAVILISAILSGPIF